MSLSVCLLLDDRSDRAVRQLWRRLEDAGLTTLLSHTHGRHVPHLTLASLLSYDLEEVRAALTERPQREPTDLHLDAPFTWAGPTVARGRRRALRDCLMRICDLAVQSGVDAVCCGGDLYEQELRFI